MGQGKTKAIIKVALAAGGTGGHLFPAEATARALLEQGAVVDILTDSRGTNFSDDLGGIPILRLPAPRLGDGLVGKMRTAFALVPATFAALRLLRRARPDVVVGFGGYPSVAPLLAAIILRIPVVIHDQNAVLGRANQLFVPFARLIAASFPSLAGLDPAKHTLCVTGNPVRPEMRALLARPYPALAAGQALNLLVTGGSQGARVFSEIVPAAIGKLAADLRRRIKITQQCRAEDIDAVRAAYRALGQDAELAPFFRDLPDRLALAHLVIGRAGASTIAELGVAGRPAILVPLPHAVTGEQKANAEMLERAGGGWMILQKDFTPGTLAHRLEEILATPAILTKASEGARSMAMPDAASALARAIIGVAQGGAENFSQSPQSKVEKAA